MMRERIPSLRVRIVGGGPCAAALRERSRALRLEGTVEWLGTVSRAALAAEYNRADIFCSPSVQEGFGIVFLEAMAAGKPVVAARAGAAPEVVRHGMLVEPESAQAIASGIEQLKRSPGLRASLGRAGIERAREFDAPRVARLFLDAVSGVAIARAMGSGA
jgi:glycosyltransferase involved in cell wall biosynthesis